MKIRMSSADAGLRSDRRAILELRAIATFRTPTASMFWKMNTAAFRKLELRAAQTPESCLLVDNLVYSAAAGRRAIAPPAWCACAFDTLAALINNRWT